MSEIEKMRRYIEKYKVPRTPRYDASINEIIAIASEMSPMEAANFAFDNINSTSKNGGFRQVEVIPMKQHRFWAWGAVFCMVMVMLTGYKRK